MRGITIEVTPTISTSAYGAGDQVGTLMTLAGVNKSGGHVCVLENVTIIDKAKQNAAIQIVLFDASPTVASSDNAAADVSDAEMIDKALAVVAVAAGDYTSLNANSIATKLSGAVLEPVADRTLYALALTSGTPTYGSASDLVFKFTFRYEG